MVDVLAPPAAVYIHIPFCANKCHYCDFNSYAVKGQPVNAYLDALEREMQKTVDVLPPGTIETVYVGGGTPTVLTTEQMERFLRTVNAYFPNRSADFEFTMEANPGTADPDKLHAIREGGVNRISFGVQSFDQALLKRIGRIHNAEDVYRSLDTAQQAGFRNISIDLMFGLPDQTEDMLRATLDEALALKLQHYSIYGLKVEENTLFHTLYMKDRLPLPEEETEARMFQTIMDRLEAGGYRQYEISNFALPGYESRHNTMYWRNRAYYGIGAGAHGYASGVRHANIEPVQQYIDAAWESLPRSEETPVSREEAMEDFMMVGLRLLEGVLDADFQAQFGVSLTGVFGSVLDEMLSRKLMVRTENGYRLIREAVPFANIVFGGFIGHLTS